MNQFYSERHYTGSDRHHPVFTVHVHVYNYYYTATITLSFLSSVNLTLRQSIPVTSQDYEVIQLQSDNIWSQINLTCTVDIEGSFQWVWSGPIAVDMSQQVFADTNRSTSITLTQLSTDFAGSYSCRAVYDPCSLPLGMTTSANGSQTITLQFESKYAICLHNE